MTGDDHNTDALIAALRSPALPAERAGEAAAVTAMLGVLARNPASTRFRAGRGIAIAVVTVASLGVGGLAAAGPGVFQAAAGKARSLITADSADDNENADGAVTGNAPHSGSLPSLIDDPGFTPAAGGAAAGLATASTAQDGVVVPVTAPPPPCADGNHGDAVSPVANATVPPDAEQDHDDAVNDAAHAICTPQGPQGNAVQGSNPNKPTDEQTGPVNSNPNGNQTPGAGNNGNQTGAGSGNQTPGTGNNGNQNGAGNGNGGVGAGNSTPPPTTPTPGNGQGQGQGQGGGSGTNNGQAGSGGKGDSNGKSVGESNAQNGGAGTNNGQNASSAPDVSVPPGGNGQGGANGNGNGG